MEIVVKDMEKVDVTIPLYYFFNADIANLTETEINEKFQQLDKVNPNKDYFKGIEGV